MPSLSSLRRPLRRLVDVALVEQTLRWVSGRRATRRRGSVPPDALVTSSGRGVLVRDALPSPATLAFGRLVREASRRDILIVRPRILNTAIASALTELTVRGVPTWVDAPEGIRADDAVEERLWALLTEPPKRAEPDLERYVRSVRLARAASPEPDSALVTVLLASRRPAMIEHAVGEIRRQRDVELQLVIGLHGGWPDEAEGRLAELWPAELVTLRADDTTSLGALLGQMADRADGRLVTKWDDDDWYGPHHVGDLVRAHAASGAELVGKAAEFVWLETVGETIRRPATGARTYSANVAGGTLALTKADLIEVGGFSDVRRSVDRNLIDRVRASGGSVYRTHGLEYVLRRSSSDEHTWNAETKYFLDDAIARRPGLDLAFADIHPDETGSAPR